MPSIHVTQDQLEYVGFLSPPAFPLLSRPEQVVSGLYFAFVGLHSGLENFAVENDSQVPLSQIISVNLTDRGTYRFSSERIEWVFPEAGSWELDASVLSRGEAWLRSALPNLKFQSHYYTYFAHGWLLDGSAADFLVSLGSPELPGFGENQGTGLVFHANFPDHNWAIQLTVDHSNILPGALFVQIVTTVEGDRIDHAGTVRHIDALFHEGLKRLGLELERSIG